MSVRDTLQIVLQLVHDDPRLAVTTATEVLAFVLAAVLAVRIARAAFRPKAKGFEVVRQRDE